MRTVAALARGAECCLYEAWSEPAGPVVALFTSVYSCVVGISAARNRFSICRKKHGPNQLAACGDAGSVHSLTVCSVEAGPGERAFRLHGGRVCVAEKGRRNAGDKARVLLTLQTTQQQQRGQCQCWAGCTRDLDTMACCAGSRHILCEPPP